MSIEGRAVIVTGAASGIGLATVERLAGVGARVTAIDINEDSLRYAASRLESPDGISWHRGDVRVLEDMASIADAVFAREGRIDALIGCAGLADMSSVATGDVDRWLGVLSVNTLGPMVASRAVTPYMLQQGYGDIVIVTSASGRITYVGEPAYIASKHGAIAFLDSMRKELSATDIRVTSIEPGLVDTPMSRAHPFIATILKDVEPLQPSDVAGLIEYCIALPRHINVNELVVRPTRQEL